jgi:probable selenium-dependent hydroxylase accessory protein YqeC
MNALGKPATEAIVHRLPEFLSLTGQREGEPITMQALEAMVCNPGGMFKNSAGQKHLLVNQAEGDAAANAARSFLLAVKEKYPNRFKKLLFGSVFNDAWQEV